MPGCVFLLALSPLIALKNEKLPLETVLIPLFIVQSSL